MRRAGIENAAEEKGTKRVFKQLAGSFLFPFEPGIGVWCIGRQPSNSFELHRRDSLINN